MSQAHPLDGRRALVIGAGSPAGRAIAVALAEAGADVAVAASSIDGEEVMACRRTRRAIEKLGRRSAEYAFDVTLGQNVQVSTRQVAKELGGLDILVYAVSSVLERPTDKVTDAEWSRSLAVNVSGAFYACRAALREMLPGESGALLLVHPSPPARSGGGLTLSHSTSGAVAALARGLAAEFAGRGIRAYAIAALDAGDSGQDDAAPRTRPDAGGALAGGATAGAAQLPEEIGALAVFLVSVGPEEYNGGVFRAVLPV